MSINLEEISVRELARKDVSKKYMSWINNKKTMAFTSFVNQKSTLNDIKKYVILNKRSKTNFLYGIFHKRKHIGNIKVGNINFKHKIAEISYFIGDKEYLRKGVTKHTIMKIISITRLNNKVDKLTAYSYSLNKPSIKLLKSCGFIKEGVLINHHIYNNKRTDIEIFSYLYN